MPALSRIRTKQTELIPPLNGMASRGRSLRILFIHSNATDVDRCVRELNAANFKVTADVVPGSEQFTKRLGSKVYDIILAKHPLPDWRGIPALELLQQMDALVPLIFVTDQLPLETVAELITSGAVDCIEMEHVGHLPVAVRRALSENNLRAERDRAEKQLRHSEAHYRALVGNLSYGICRCSASGKFLDVNQTLVTMLGYASREELLEVNLASDIVSDPRKRAQLLGHSGTELKADPIEIDWKRRDGTGLKVRLSGREVSGSEGEMDGYEVIAEDVTKQRELEDHLRQQASKDPLTGLANYRHLVNVLDSEIKRSERTKREFALLLFDLDGLKEINDRYGHLAGSQALCRLADVLSIGCRDTDTAARFGGDEFALVLPETGWDSANLVAHRICESLAKDGRTPSLSVSVGVALYPTNGDKLDTLLGAADVALYSMKAQARDRTKKPKKQRTASLEITRRRRSIKA
jgi:diguanylate cyclase (GGDEF)-like protein/PAS domain S-box-containing protein